MLRATGDEVACEKGMPVAPVITNPLLPIPQVEVVPNAVDIVPVVVIGPPRIGYMVFICVSVPLPVLQSLPVVETTPWLFICKQEVAEFPKSEIVRAVVEASVVKYPVLEVRAVVEEFVTVKRESAALN